MDVGGTFTDLALDDGRRLRVAKVPSTPADQAEGVLTGLSRLEVEAADLARLAHGTTVATNAVLERHCARTVLVTTKGFRDLLEIGRQNRPKLYDLFADRPPPLVPRELVVEVAERVAADGRVLQRLDDPSAIAAAVGALGPEAVAVCLLFSFLHPDHERAIGDGLAGLGIPVSLSSEVLPVFREYERASTTALNAAVAPVMSGYLDSLRGRLQALGLGCEVEVMRSGGGTFGAEEAARFPVHTLLSGPAAGAWGAAAVGAAAGFGRVIAFDMGGTSTDVTLIEHGRPRRSGDGRIGGLPFGVPSTEIHTVGAGGGSVAWRDEGGALRVGPRSAGAVPGPACYGRGGTEPTVTDACLLLGMLDGESPLAGTVRLHPGPTQDAVAALAAAIGMDVPACAAGIVRVAEAQIAAALRVVSVERGLDPRDFALLAFGGAGPLHQGPLSRELGCETVVVPRYPGVLSAIGLLAAPRGVDLVRTRIRELRDIDADELEEGWMELEEEARRSLAAQGVQTDTVRRSADCRYRGQAFEVEVEARPEDRGLPGALAAAFHLIHQERYGFADTDGDVQVVNLRVRADGAAHAPTFPKTRPGRGPGSARTGVRPVRLGDREADVPVFDRDGLGEGDRLPGPAIVAGLDSTCLLLPGQKAEVDGRGNLIVREA